jgi:plasmid stabilization system protein ParE
MRVRLARLAQRDIADATDWYEAQRAGLSARFINAVDRVLTRIGDNPAQFPAIHASARRALVGRFPYGVYFEVVGEYVRVVAIVHLKREAQAWRSRL